MREYDETLAALLERGVPEPFTVNREALLALIRGAFYCGCLFEIERKKP